MKARKRVFLKWLKIALIFITSFFVIGGIILFLKSDFWLVKKISCQPPCQSDVQSQLTSLTEGKNILFLSSKVISQKVLETFLIVKEAKIKKRLPNKLVYEFKIKEPQVALIFEVPLESPKVASDSSKPEFLTTGEFLIVDSEGVLLEKAESSNLPLLLLKGLLDLQVGQKVDQEEILITLKIIRDLKLALFEPKLGKIVFDRTLEIWLSDNLEVFFSLMKEEKPQLDSLQFIFSRAKIEGKKIKKVDLRFDKPVVIYE